MRLLIRLILPLCFLLLGRFAYTYETAAYCSLQNVFESSVQANLFAGQFTRGLIYSDAPTNTRNEYDHIKALEIGEEDDDDESEFSKKSSKNDNSCISFYNAGEPGSICRYFNNRLPFCEHLSWSSSNKFLIHRVIRI
jgi:hypothetical protein